MKKDMSLLLSSSLTARIAIVMLTNYLGGGSSSSSVHGFVPLSTMILPKNHHYHNHNHDSYLDVKPSSSLRAVTIEAPPPTPTTTKQLLDNDNDDLTWECNEEAECVVVPACNEEVCRTSLDVRIHGNWYDLTGWRKAHPAGEHWIDWYDGRDATEVMDAFHSEKGRQMYQRLPKSKPHIMELLSKTTVEDSPTQIAFRQLRQELQDEGYWERDYLHEMTLLSIWASLVIGAAMTATSIPLISTFLLGLSMTAAGWLGHDYIHGVDPFANTLRNFAALAAGLHPTWWSDKHNKHHALTNEMGVDEDIATDPFLYQWVPAPENDSPLRKIQHYIFVIPFSFLFALWRVDSIKVAIDAVEKKRPNAKEELYSLLIHYVILFNVFPINVWIPAVFMSGLVSALIVTPTHQSEEMFDEYQPDWVTAQFRSTRNAVTTNPFSEWIWGGMQYQLEHHLFPSMPRNKYPLLKERLQTFAKDNQIPGGYRESGEFEILKMNWELYKRVAEADPIPGSPPTRGRIGQVGAIIMDGTNSPASAAAAAAAAAKAASKAKATASATAAASASAVAK